MVYTFSLFHRVYATRKVGFEEIGVQIHNGSLRDAVLYALGANASHGLRRTNADKRKAVSIMLGDEEWSKLSNREISRQCGVSLDLVNSVRKSASERFVQMGTERTVTRNGTTYTQNTSNIGKSASRSTNNTSETLEEQDDNQDCEEPPESEEPPQPEEQKANHQLLNTSVSNEWYTPKPFLEAAREVMGEIDLDPASNFFANQTVKLFQKQKSSGQPVITTLIPRVIRTYV